MPLYVDVPTAATASVSDRQVKLLQLRIQRLARAFRDGPSESRWRRDWLDRLDGLRGLLDEANPDTGAIARAVDAIEDLLPRDRRPGEPAADAQQMAAQLTQQAAAPPRRLRRWRSALARWFSAS